MQAYGPRSLWLAVLHPILGCSFLASTGHEHFEPCGQFGSVGKYQRPEFPPWLFAKSCFFLKFRFLILEIRGLDDEVLALAIPLPYSSQDSSFSSIRFSNVSFSERSPWVAKLKCVPQHPCHKPLCPVTIRHFPCSSGDRLGWSFYVFNSLFLFSKLLAFMYMCQWEKETYLFHSFYTLFTI